MRRKFLSVLLAMSMVLTLLPATAWAAAGATIGDITISGKVGEALTDTNITVTVNDEVTLDGTEAAKAANYTVNTPAGVSVTKAVVADKAITLTVSGTPTATSSDGITVTIKQAVMTGADADLEATANANAKWRWNWRNGTMWQSTL